MLALMLASEGGTFLQEYFHLLTNAAHICFELTLELITGVIVYPFAKKIWEKAVIKHDKEHHGHDEPH